MAKKPSGMGIGGIFLFAIIALLVAYRFDIGNDNSGRSDEDETTAESIETTGAILPPLKEQLRTIVGDTVYLSSDTSILEQCGIADITDVELLQDSGEPHHLKVYKKVYDKDRSLLLTFEKGSLYYVAFNGTDLYNTTEGVIMKMQDVHVPITEIPFSYGAQLQMICEDIIKKYLNYPATADFHTFDWAYGREDNNYIVKGAVTASNAFGVKEKMPFTVWLEHDPGADNMTPTGVSLNGNIVYRD